LIIEKLGIIQELSSIDRLLTLTQKGLTICNAVIFSSSMSEKGNLFITLTPEVLQ